MILFHFIYFHCIKLNLELPRIFVFSFKVLASSNFQQKIDKYISFILVIQVLVKPRMHHFEIGKNVKNWRNYDSEYHQILKILSFSLSFVGYQIIRCQKVSKCRNPSFKSAYWFFRNWKWWVTLFILLQVFYWNNFLIHIFSFYSSVV